MPVLIAEVEINFQLMGLYFAHKFTRRGFCFEEIIE